MTLTSITAYSDYRRLAPYDTDGTDFRNFFDLIDAKITSFSQEVRLAGQLGDSLNYTLGASYQKDKVDDDEFGDTIYTGGGIGPRQWAKFVNRANQQIETKSVFANLEYKITDRVTLQAAARYTDQKRDFQGCLLDGGDGLLAAGLDLIRLGAMLPSQQAPNGGCVTFDDTTLERQDVVEDNLNEDNLSWRAGINWKPVSSTLVYANVTKGYKSGYYRSFRLCSSASLRR